MSVTKQPPESNTSNVQSERVAILRSGHGRTARTFTTQASYIVSSDGTRLLSGRHVTAQAFGALIRNAEAAEMEEQRRRFNSRRQPRTADRKEAA
jgi:hypothetical protein